jgi:hypothetical protein
MKVTESIRILRRRLAEAPLLLHGLVQFLDIIKLLAELRRRYVAVLFIGYRVRFLLRARIFVSCVYVVCWVSSGTWDGLITR